MYDINMNDIKKRAIELVARFLFFCRNVEYLKNFVIFLTRVTVMCYTSALWRENEAKIT